MLNLPHSLLSLSLSPPPFSPLSLLCNPKPLPTRPLPTRPPPPSLSSLYPPFLASLTSLHPRRPRPRRNKTHLPIAAIVVAIRKPQNEEPNIARLLRLPHPATLDLEIATMSFHGIIFLDYSASLTLPTQFVPPTQRHSSLFPHLHLLPIFPLPTTQKQK
uniref:Uncharacterized protein n=1 Tax=Malus domestica TaxID=3750 RepID=G0XZC2_MALDO|nr:hypothetical protein [Malus domestica]